jgi:drug/metabolite transporter (DMT)-like permease
LALHFGLWIASLEQTSVASSVALVTVHPLIVAISAPVVLGERVPRRLWLGVVLACLGSAVISLGDAGEPRRLAGDMLALGGGLAFAAYVIVGRGLRSGMDLPMYLALVYSFAAAFLLVASLAAGAPLTGFSTGTWAAFVAMALIPQLIGHSSFNWALQHVSATVVSATIVGEVAGSALLAWAVLAEPPPPTAVAGGGLILAGLILAGSSERRARRIREASAA